MNDNARKVTIMHVDDNNQHSEPTHFDQEIIQNTNNKHIIYNVMNHRYFMPTIYAISGVILLFILTVMFNTYILCLKVETAVVTAPIETMVAPVSGFISEIYVLPGQKVKKGTPLLKVENIDLERDLKLARVQLEESKLQIAYYQHLLTNEEQRLKVYQSVGSSRVESAQTMVNVSKQDMLTAKYNINRLKTLHDKHYISEANWEAELAKYVNAQERLKSAKAQHELEHNSLNAVDKGIYFTGSKIEGTTHDLSAELEAAQNKTKLNEERVKIYEGLIAKLTLRAPYDGVITQILKTAGNTTDNNKPVLLVEQIKINKNIVAYLTQSEIAHISSPDKVKIYIPSTGKTYLGKITEINRTDGFVDTIKAQYKWRDLEMDRSAMVTIDISNSDQKDFNMQAFSGMPVIVYFSRRLFV